MTSFLTNLVGSDSLSKAAGDHLSVSLELDGTPAVIEIGGKALTELETGWSQASQKELLNFLRDYRTKPGNTQPQRSILESLHNFLFADRAFDGVFAKASDGCSEIIVNGDHLARSLLINIPWELAEGIPQVKSHSTRESQLYGTLASLPLARVIENTKSNLVVAERERLNVIYCISEPSGVSPINAKGFFQALDRTLRDRSGMLQHKPILGTNFSPHFGQLLAQIDLQPPHILILVCHGQTAQGVPQLRFEDWKPVNALAAALGRKGKTFFVLLIACDQVYLEDGPSAHSGALAMIESGIPWVVAMQSSVSARLAGDFLGATVDQFFQTGSIAKSVAAGRIQMAPSSAAAKEYIDWSFPALFITEDAPLQEGMLSELIQGYVPALEQMLRKIPIPEPYFSREKLEKSLDAFLMPGSAGLRVVAGMLGMGKTSLVRHVCRRAIESAIRKEDPSFRPILYVDLDRYPDSVQTVQELSAVLRRQTEEVQPSGPGPRLINWQKARRSSEMGQTDVSLRSLLALLDENKMVLVLDNVPATNKSPWPEFIEGSKTLINSLVVMAGDAALGAGIVKDKLLLVEALTLDETKNYAKSVASSQVDRADDWYRETGGVLLLLNETRSAEDNSSMQTPDLPSQRVGSDVALEYASMVASGLSDPELILLYTMVHLPNGVNSELAWEYVCDWRDVSELAQAGFFLREYRFNLSAPWLRLPALLANALREIDTDTLEDAGRALANGFIKSIRPNEDADVASNLIKVAEKRGGRDFIQDIHTVFLEYGYSAFARALPLWLHDWLVERGRWFDALKLWERLLTTLPLPETKPYEWLRFGSVAQVLGMRALGYRCIDNASDLGPARLDEIDMKNLEAALIKDSGETDKAEKVVALYDEALGLIDAAEAAIRRGEESDEEIVVFHERRALIIYNRALFRRYWLRDLDSALADLQQASVEFKRIGLHQRRALADCEWVEVQLDWPNHEKNWPEMAERLFEANAVFASNDNYGDRAFCSYQLARYYRRLPADEKEKKANAAKARDAYLLCREQAKAAGDLRLEQIAEGHVVEVCWRDLGEMSDSEATQRLDGVTRLLNGFGDDAWSKRVLRDMLLLRAHTARKLYPQTVLASLEQAWSVALKPPLHPNYRQDARRAARILCEYLEELDASRKALEADTVSFSSKEMVAQWLQRDIHPLNRQEWQMDVCEFSIGPGEYYGQSKTYPQDES